MHPTIIFLAGIGNSDQDHWQRRWFEQFGGVWVEHRSWDEPDCGEWVADLDAVLAAASGPRLLIAHSLGCLVAFTWAQEHPDAQIVGGFFVACPDPRGPGFPSMATSFSLPSARPLPFPSVVVASEGDPYASLEFSARLARAIGSTFVDVGARGHVNAASGLGDWQEGRTILSRHFPLAVDQIPAES